MKNRIIKKTLLSGAVALAFIACSDTWDSHYSVDTNMGSNTNETLWDIISSDTSLTEFAGVLKEAGYDTILNGSRYYTVWAPTNGFLSQAENDGVLTDSTVVYEFIQNHIADYSHLGTGTLMQNKVKMHNEKLIDFVGTTGNYTFKNVAVTKANVPAKNGIIHHIGRNGEYAQFTPNIWEYLDKDTTITIFRDFIKSFTKREIDPVLSVQGPMVNGKVTYLDIVWQESNPWWSKIGELNNEDSSYTMIIPTNKAWDEMYEMAKSYFVFDARTETEEADSLQDKWAKDYMCRHLVFSNTIQKNREDSLISNYIDSRQSVLPTVFRYDEMNALFADEVDKEELSNGSVHIVDKLNYSPIKCWHDTIKVQGESLGYNEEYNDDNNASTRIQTHYLSKSDSIRLSDNAYAAFIPLRSSGNIDATYLIPRTLSAKYRIKVVLAPAAVQNTSLVYGDTTLLKPTKLKATLYYPDEKGKSKNTKLGTYVRGGYNRLSPYALDTIILNPDVDEFKGKFSDEDYTFTFKSNEDKISAELETMTKLKISSDVSSSQRKDYDRTLRIDCIILEPVE